MKIFLFIAGLLARCFCLQAQPIQSAEYFFDADPGYGRGVQLGIAAAGENVKLQMAIPVAGLPSGLHNLYVRTQNSRGQWSLPEARLIYVAAVAAYTAGSPVALEYFFDQDPGVGKGVPVAVAEYFQGPQQVLIRLDRLASGLHQLYLRARSAAGHWSLTESRSFYIAAAAVAPVSAAEYFFNADPGQGNATALPLAAGSPAQFAAEITLPQQPGLHQLYVRTRSADGLWSLVERRQFYVAAPQKGQRIVRAEYFFDADPGQGAGQPLQVVPGDSLRLAGALDVPYAQPGMHQLYLRTAAEDGVWSLVESRSFYVLSRRRTKLTGAEYFFDTDPGHGSGTPLAVPAGEGQPLMADLPMGRLADGFHQLYVRTRNEAGVWSLVDGQLFYISQALNKWVQAEYFFNDQDPGVGKGVPVNLNLSANTNQLQVVLPDTLRSGTHTITLRARNGEVAWNYSETKTFTVKGADLPVQRPDIVLPVKLEYFRGVLQQSNVVLQWKTALEEKGGQFEIERSANGFQFVTLGVVKAGGSPCTYTDKNPGGGALYYRLKHRGANGEAAYSGVLYFYLSAKESLHLYPNPATTSVFLRLPAEAASTSLRVIGLSGQVVYTAAAQNKTLIEIPVRQLPAGRYYVEVVQDKTVTTLSFLKQSQ